MYSSRNSNPPRNVHRIAMVASNSICGMLKGGFSNKALSPWMRSKTPSKTYRLDLGEAWRTRSNFMTDDQKA